jgi:hypothetical protein
MNLKSCDKTDELRRLAAQIAIQLPESVADARRVLKMAGDLLDNFLVEGGAERSPWQRARRLGWRIDADAEDPVPGDHVDLAPAPGPIAAIACSLATLLVTVPLSAALLVGLDYSGGFCFLCGVLIAAMLFGSGPALLLAVVSPIVHNILVLPPVLQFNSPTTRDLLVAGFYMVAAVAVPWLMRRAPDLQRLAARLSQRRPA